MVAIDADSGLAHAKVTNCAASHAATGAASESSDATLRLLYDALRTV